MLYGYWQFVPVEPPTPAADPTVVDGFAPRNEVRTGMLSVNPLEPNSF